MTKTFWQRQFARLSAIVTLAAWRWHQQWLLLLVTGLGVLIATTLICVLPLFSAVMVTAGLRGTLRSIPDSTRLEASVNMASLTSQNVKQSSDHLATMMQNGLAPYVQPTVIVPPQIESGGWITSGSSDQVVLRGASMSASAGHLQVVQGRLPVDTGTTLEAAMTPSAARYLGVQIGSTIELLGQVEVQAQDGTDQPQIYAQVLTLHVVGLFQTLSDDPYWFGQTFEEDAPSSTGLAPFHLLLSATSLLHLFDGFAHQYQTSSDFLANAGQLLLAYNLDPAQMRSDELADLITNLGQLQSDAARQRVAATDGPLAPPYITGITLSGAILHGPSSPDLLNAYQSQVQVGQATTFILIIQIVGLMLFFMSILASVQVERQAIVLALLRCRGASRIQILGTLLTQGGVLWLLAGLVAPLLAVGVLRLWAPVFLNAQDQDALNILPTTLPALFQELGAYVLIAFLVVGGTLLLAFLLALRGDIQKLRQETARTTRRPFWQRLRLDLALAGMSILGYGFLYYTQNIQQLLDVHTQQLLLTPLNLCMTFLLLLAALLGFLRLFPVCLRLCMRLTARWRGAVSLLTLAQMERAPRQATRLALLLGLTIAFSLFTLAFSASQTQRAQDLASYQAGADFSGVLPLNLQAAAANDQAVSRRYRSLPGVTFVSLGYTAADFFQINAGSPNAFLRPLQVRAVDPQTFAQTADWSELDSTQPLSALLTKLVALRAQAQRQHIVPAILSASAWDLLHLHAGAIFTIVNDSGSPDPLQYMAVAEVAHIPPANEGAESGMLVDIQSLLGAAQQAHEPLQPDYIWLHTSSSADMGSLTALRHALSASPLALGDMNDRRLVAQLISTNPLALNLLAILSLGVLTTLLMALLAQLLLPLLALRARLTSFAFLRALGAAPGLVTRLLVWEQAMVLVAALLPGVLLGFLFVWLAVPPLIVSTAPVVNTQRPAGDNAYLLQQVIPARLVWPPSLWLALLALLVLGVITLLLFVLVALRPALGRQLRFTEDQ